MGIVTGMLWRPMRCPKCNNIMLERVNNVCGTNWGECDCGYDYDDDYYIGDEPRKVEEEGEQDEFYNAQRPKDKQEEAAWWEKWRNAHPEIPDPREKDREWKAYLDGLPPAKNEAPPS